MFAIGEAKLKVYNGRLTMPAEYHLKKRKIYGTWVGECKLYISDEEKSLYSHAGRDGIIFEVHIDSYNRIELSTKYNGMYAFITGCILTIEISFQK